HEMKIRFGISLSEEVVKALDESIKRKGRFANRSQAIEYCIKQVLALENYEERTIEFLHDFLKIVEEHPEVSKLFRETLENWR
ncbi:MAG: hypothetical protein ACXQTW_01065, partial [Candidatus Methanospirareceae archaeon]